MIDKEELNNLKVLYDDIGKYWCINKNSNDEYEFGWIDSYIAESFLNISKKEYFGFLTSNGGEVDPQDTDCIKFETKELAENCLQKLKDKYKNDLIEEEFKGKHVKFIYLNWKGEVGAISAIPIKIWYGKTDFYKDEQWFMKALDIDKQAERDFALKDIIKYI